MINWIKKFIKMVLTWMLQIINTTQALNGLELEI